MFRYSLVYCNDVDTKAAIDIFKNSNFILFNIIVNVNILQTNLEDLKL